MRYTAPTAHSKLQTAASKYVEFKVYSKVVTTFNEDISTGTWVNLSTRIIEMPSVKTQLEYNLGQFVTDSLSFKGRDIAYFKSLFNLSAGQYLEIKVTGQLGYAYGSMESTVAVLFAGFADIATINYNEALDEVRFTAYALDDFTGRITAENLTTRYVVQNITGTTEGLYLPKIPGLYVTNANVSSYVLQLGTHTINFRYSSPNYQAKLDGGSWTNLTANAETTLIDLAGTQKITVYAKSAFWLQAEAEDNVIVKTAGDTLPYTWYAYTWIDTLLKTSFTQAGARTFSFDSLQLNTYDSTRRLSFMDIPPNDPSIEGYRFAICENLADSKLYIGVKGNLYERNMVNNTYTLLATVDSNADTFIFDIQVCIPNEGASYIFVFYIAGAGGSYVKRCSLTGSGLTAAINTGMTLHGGGAKVFNYEYDSPDYIYDILLVDDENNRILKIAVEAWTSSSLFTFAGLGYTTGYLAGPGLKRGSDKFYFLVREDAAITYGCYLHYVQYTLVGTWAWRNQGSPYEIDGGSSDIAPEMVAATVDTSRDYWYYYDYIDNLLKRLAFTSSTETTVASSVTVIALYYNPGEAVTYYILSNGKIYSVATTSPTYLDETVIIASAPMLYMAALAGNSSATYGIDGTGLLNGRLFKVSASLEMYVTYGNFPALMLKEAIIEMLNGFNLIYNVRPDKTIYVYRRGNTSGTPVTTGNTLTGGNTLASQITLNTTQFLKVGLVTVANEEASVNYNGTSFNVTVLSDVRRLEVSNRFTPTKLLKDLAYFIYQYYKTTRLSYTVAFENIPYWQYEPLDGLSINLAATKIGATGTGLIVMAEYNNEGGSSFLVIL